jgi:hypothetical protein
MLRNTISKRNVISFSLVLLALAVLAAVILPLMTRVAQADERNGELHVTKNCTYNLGAAGAYCTITDSNLPEIEAGSRVFYTQAVVDPTTPEGSVIGLDSNAVLYVGTGNWAIGRCTLDSTGNLGLCTFSDGIGRLAGFRAHVDVSSTDDVKYYWNGTYSFTPDHK